MTERREDAMYPDKLPSYSKYLFTENDIFKGETDVAHAFIKHNYQRDMHTQEYFEIVMIGHGVGIHYIAEERFFTSTGDVFIIPPHTSHGFYPIESLDVYHLILRRDFLKKHETLLSGVKNLGELLETGCINGRSALSLGYDKFKEIKLLFKEMMLYHKSSDPTCHTVQTGLAVAIVSIITHLYNKTDPKRDSLTTSRNAIMNILPFISERIGERITVEGLAKEINLSRSTFIRRFTEICKVPPYQYIAEVRIKASRDAIDEGVLSLSEIAQKCGFCDSAHLSREFRKKYGESPLEYKKKKRL